MKKIFSLVCATLLVFSASAAPVAKKAELVKKAPVAVEQMQKVQFEEAQSVKTLSLENAQLSNQLSANPAVKVNNFKPQALAKASQATQAEPIVVIIKGNPQIVSKSGKTTIEATGNDDIIYGWVISTESLEAGKTYTYADMGEYNVYRYDNSFTVYEDATDGTFSIDADNNITASMVTESGTYLVYTNDPTPQPSYDTIPVTVAAYQEKYYASSLDWQVIMVDAAGNGYSLDIFAPAGGFESGKTYTSDNGDFDLDYTYAQVNKVNDFAVKASFTKTVSATAIEVVAEMTTAANHVYQFSYTEKIIQWTEWKKFAPLGKSTGTWAFGAVSSLSGATCVSNIYVREDKDNSATQQIKVEGWGAEVLSTSGVDLIIDWDTITNVCTIAEQSTGAYQSAYGEYTMISDLNTYTGGTSYPSSYDPATGKFSLAVVYYISKGTFGYGTETLQMKSSEIKPLQYDATDADFSADFSNDDTKVSITGTTATVSATDADLKTLSLEMYVTSGSAQIPAGDYTITDSKEVGTALASEGVSGGYVTASFAGNRNTSGQITTPMWFLVEGNVNVAYNGYIMTLTVAAKNSNGKNINITVTKDYTPVTERDTVDIVSTALKYNDLIASNKVTIYYATDVEGYYLFRVTSNNATSVDGTFKWSDGTINNPNSYFSVSGSDKNYFTDGEFTVVTNNKDIALTGWMIGEDEKYYRLNMSYTTPTERDTLKFSGQGVTISECTSSQTGVQTGWFYQLTDASTGYEFLLQSNVVAEQYGTFSYADKTLGSNYYNVFDPQGNRQQFVEGSITVSNDGSEIVLDGELIAEDEKVYVLHFTQSASVLNYDTDAPFDATFEYTDMSTDLDEGVIGIYATNAEGLTIGLELYADPTATKIPEGVYTISDTQEAGTALQSLGVAGGYLTECWAGVRTSSGISDCWFMVEGTITLSYDEYDKLKVVVDAKNSYGQPVTALVQYVKLEPKNTVDFTDAELYVYDGYVEQYGIMNFYGGNADGYEFDLYAYSNTVAGDFLEAIDFGDCELTSPAGSIGIIDAYEFKVEADGKNLTLTAKVLGSDTVQYNITAIGYLGYIDGDAKEAYEGEFAVEEIAAQQITISKVNYIYIQGLNAAGDKFQLVVEGEMEDEAIAAGEYTNVMASTGYDAQDQLNPSFVTDADNNDWFIQSGKLTVNENGSMVFEGVNSYDASVVINVTVPAPEVTDYYLVGWINNAAYGIEGDIDNFGDYHFVDGKVKATFNDLSYVQVKDNNKQIYGTDSYIAPVESGNATLVANGPEKIAINGGVEYEYTLVVNEDGSLTLSYEVVKTALDNINAGKKAAKAIKNGMIVIEKDGKAYNVLGIAL